MSAQIPSTEPTSIVAGDRVQWTRDITDYPAGTWTLSYAFRHSTAVPVNVTATANGTQHVIDITATASQAFAAGSWFWFAQVTSGADRRTIGDGVVSVTDNPATSANPETRSTAKQILDAIDAAILGSATSVQLEWQIGDRRVREHSKAELIQMRDYYSRLVATEEQRDSIAKGMGNPGRIQIRTGNYV